MEKLQIERIKNEGIIDIKLSGSFYKRIQQVLNFIASIEDKDSLTDLIDKLNDEVSDEKDYNPISSLLNTKKEVPKIEKKDFSDVPSDDPVMKFFDSLK